MKKVIQKTLISFGPVRYLIRYFLGVACVILSLAPTTAPTTTSGPTITIQHNEPTVKRTMFDRAHPPSDMPQLSGNEAALTQSEFLCGAGVEYDIVKHEQVGDHWHVTARIHTAKVRTNLTDTIFLPQMAPLVLRAHEEGHREMNEQVYKTAEAVARKAAQDMMARDWEADGPDLDAAGKAATDLAVNSLCEQYLQGTSKRASYLGDIYDKITGHGVSRVLVAKAIQMSYEEEKKEAATRPTTNQATTRP